MPTADFRPIDVYPGSLHVDADLHQVTVKVAGADEQTGKMRFEGLNTEEMTELWKAGTEEAIFRSSIFKSQGGKKMDVKVTILEFHPPLLASTVRTQAVARYEIVDVANSTVIYSDDVQSTGVVSGNFAFEGAVRFRESANRAAQQNIKDFIDRLEQHGL